LRLTVNIAWKKNTTLSEYKTCLVHFPMSGGLVHFPKSGGSHKNTLIPQHFIAVPTFRLSTIFLLGFGNVPDEGYFRNVLTKFDIYVLYSDSVVFFFHAMLTVNRNLKLYLLGKWTKPPLLGKWTKPSLLGKWIKPPLLGKSCDHVYSCNNFVTCE
jgi:hypothetical protein